MAPSPKRAEASQPLFHHHCGRLATARTGAKYWQANCVNLHAVTEAAVHSATVAMMRQSLHIRSNCGLKHQIQPAAGVRQGSVLGLLWLLCVTCSTGFPISLMLP